MFLLRAFFLLIPLLEASHAGVAAAPSRSILTSNELQQVRDEMARPLTVEERNLYRGITYSAMTGTKFDKLFGIESAQELVLAEHFGSQLIPADDPERAYLFSMGRGLSARYDPEYVQKGQASKGPGGETRKWTISNSTIDELDTQFRNVAKPITPEEEQVGVEKLLDEIAQLTLDWAHREFFGRLQPQARANYYCKYKEQHCTHATDCTTVRTIQRYECHCTYYTCVTQDEPVPPYPCHIGIRCIS